MSGLSPYNNTPELRTTDKYPHPPPYAATLVPPLQKSNSSLFKWQTIISHSIRSILPVMCMAKYNIMFYEAFLLHIHISKLCLEFNHTGFYQLHNSWPLTALSERYLSQQTAHIHKVEMSTISHFTIQNSEHLSFGLWCRHHTWLSNKLQMNR